MLDPLSVAPSPDLATSATNAPRRNTTSGMLLVLGLAAAPVAAQGSWALVANTAPPGASPTMSFDAARNQTVLTVFGGSLTIQAWERSGGSWSLRGSTATQTNVRQHMTSAFDGARNMTVVFGGGSGEGGNDETSQWDGSVWQPGGSPTAPPHRTRHAMAFDGARGVSVLFGGQHWVTGTPIVRQDTWTFDGTQWTQRFPATFPAVRCGHAMAYDSARARVVLFGGTSVGWTPSPPPSAFHGDTWEWDGSNWFERVSSSPVPSPRHEHAMAYDPVAQVTYLFGGYGPDGSPLGDLWSWNGTRWTQLLTASSPARRGDCALAFDTARGKLVLYGGLNADWATYVQNHSGTAFLRDTWEYTPGTVGSFTSFGAGCAGSRGTPAVRAHLGARPTAGQTFRTQIDNLPLTGPAFVFLGASSTTYGGLPLPFPLAAIGMPGCTLLVSGDVLLPVQNVLGVGLLSVDVPSSAAGATLYQQALVFDPGVNALGLTASDGARLVIGG